MIEIDFSVIGLTPEQAAANLQPLLDEFRARQQIEVRVNCIEDWNEAWSEMVTVALYGHGPHVSHIGTTWISSFTRLNALRPFTGSEVAACGGGGAFLSSAWEQGYLVGEPQLWAVPWLAFAYALMYRKDLLAQAGVEERAAFASPADLARGLAQLRQGGIAIPMTMPTRIYEVNTLHISASWVWAAGGDFVSDDGKRTRFNEPEAIEGLQAYYDLRHHLPPEAYNLNEEQALNLFLEGKTAMTIGSSWYVYALALGRSVASAEVRPHLGVAALPGVPFVGGEHLVIWRHTMLHREQEQAAVKLVQFLSSREAQIRYSLLAGVLPARLDALEALHLKEDPLLKPLEHSLQIGRVYKPVRTWGLLEEKLRIGLGQIWAELFANPELPTDATLDRHLGPLARKLDITLRLWPKIT